MSVKYITVKFLAVSLTKRPCNGRFTSETAIWIQKWFKKSVGTSETAIWIQKWFKKSVGIIVFQGGDDGRGYRNMCKIAGGPKPILDH